MEKSSKEGVRTKRVNKAKTFPIPFTFVEIKKNISISTNKENKLSKEQIINQAFKFYSQGNIQKAAEYYQQAKQLIEDVHDWQACGSMILKALAEERKSENTGLQVMNVIKYQKPRTKLEFNFRS